MHYGRKIVFSTFGPGRCRSTARPRGLDGLILFLLLLSILLAVRLAAPARAATGCPGVITQDTTLTDDIVAQPGGPSECIRFGASGITLNLNGKTVDIRPLGMGGRAIVAVGVSDVTVAGPGTIKTTYDNPALSPRAIRVQYTSNISILDIRELNLDAADQPIPRGSRVGRGMDLDHVTGARVNGNEVAFYGRGIYLVNSNAAPGFDTIGSNNAHDNTIDIARSFGIGLLASSGWNITGNRVKHNGSRVNGEAGIEIQSSSFGNTISGNRANRNLGPGITVDSGASNNTIGGNDALHNGRPGAGPDLGDDNPTPSPNTWNTNNRCQFEAGSVPADVCNPGE
jgi:parallel beta-helix repeat protein